MKPGPAAGGRAAVVLGTALALTLLAALEPVVVDEAAYLAYARHVAAEPADPYGFEVFWNGRVQPAFEVLAPPVVPYWLAAGLRALGEEAWRLKLWMLPFAVALCAALDALLARFAPGLERRFVPLVALSPPLLTSFGLMLDVPSLALGLASLALFLRACDRESAGLALLAGAIGALAAQAKYTGALPVVAIAGYATLHRRWTLGLLAAGSAGLLFVGWEGLMAASYGDSHLLVAQRAKRNAVSPGLVGRMALSFLSLLGALVPVALPLGLAALGLRLRAVLAGALAPTALLAAIPFLPAEPLARLDVSMRLAGAPAEQLGFLAMGAAVLVVSVLALRRLPAAAPPRAGLRSPAELFLAGWLVLEALALFGIWSFPAGRRMLGLTTVLLLLLARRLAQRRAASRPTAPWGWLVAWSVAVALLFQATDVLDARVRSRAVPRVERELARLGAAPGSADVWYLGHWGFQHEAERAGFRPVDPPGEAISAGDWVVVPEGVARARFRAPPPHFERRATVTLRNPWPWSTIPSFYAGPVAIRRQPERQMRIDLYRVGERAPRW